MVYQTFFLESEKKIWSSSSTRFTVGKSPAVIRICGTFIRCIRYKKFTIKPVLRSLVTVRVSQINWCHFCVDINSATLAKRAGSLDKVENLEHWKESELFDDKEKVVLEYTEAVTYSDQQVSDELIERLKVYFDDDGLVELTGLIAFQNLSSKFNSALDVPAQGFCKVPK